MKTSYHRMFIIFYIREISYKSQFIKSLPVISNTRQPVLNNCNLTSRSMSLSKVNVKMFFVWNDVLFDIDIRYLILIRFDDLKIVKSSIAKFYTSPVISYLFMK